MDFGRIVTAMVTPFDSNLQIDWQQTEKLIHYLMDEQQTDSLVICGTTGESPTLTEEEKLQLFEFVVKTVNGRCKVIAGTGSNNTQHAIHMTQQAEKIGVDAALVVAPYYNRPSQEGLFQHFKAVAEATKLPIMLYNIPSRTGINIEAETTLRLSAISNIIATKECGTLDQIAAVIKDAPEHFRVYSGDDSMALPVLSVGGYGIVSVVSHIAGKELREMMQAYLAGETQKAAKLHLRLLPVFKGLFVCPNPVPVKYALGIIGMNVGGVRLPLVEADSEEKDTVRSVFAFFA